MNSVPRIRVLVRLLMLTLITRTTRFIIKTCIYIYVFNMIVRLPTMFLRTASPTIFLKKTVFPVKYELHLHK